jgi:hypothetical protein
MTNIIENWLKVSGPLPAAVDLLSKQAGKTITTSKFGEWRRGEVSLPANIHKIMLVGAIQSILHDNGIFPLPGTDYQQLVEALMPPKPKRKTYGRK